MPDWAHGHRLTNILSATGGKDLRKKVIKIKSIVKIGLQSLKRKTMTNLSEAAGKGIAMDLFVARMVFNHFFTGNMKAVLLELRVIFYSRIDAMSADGWVEVLLENKVTIQNRHVILNSKQICAVIQLSIFRREPCDGDGCTLYRLPRLSAIDVNGRCGLLQ